MNPSNPLSERKERDKMKGKKSRCEDKVKVTRWAVDGGNTRNIINVGPTQVKRRLKYCARVPSTEGS
jgi:hypothetical protein